jgi:hypothetical protein
MEFTLQRKRIDTLSDQTLFAEMERIWRLRGHRPSRTEWETSNPTVHYNTYRNHFGGWVKACIKFIEYRMGAPLAAAPTALPPSIPPEKKRQVPLGMRLKVLDRDGYTCVRCGRSPALVRGLMLHVDHLDPFAKGGKTELSNLQTLCADCNLGKGDETFYQT